MKKNLLLFLFLCLSVISFGQKLPFQGKLIESGQVVDGSRDFEFAIPAVEWSETHTGVSITDGLYFVILGSINPLPDSLFYGVTEQSMDITVGGTALSPVILFKPLSSPYEGSDLSVKNADGIVVGKLHALDSETHKNGRLDLFGTNGSRNVRIGNSGTDSNHGSIILYNENSVSKANMFIIANDNAPNGAGFITGIGDNGESGFQGGFKTWEGPDGASLPYFTLEGNQDWPSEVFIDVIKEDSTLKGRLQLATDNGDKLTATNNSVHIVDENGRASLLATAAMHLTGSSGEERVVAAIEEDGEGKEIGWMDLISSTGRRLNLHSDGFWLGGPNSANVSLGARDWDGLPDNPTMSFHGENDFHALELSVSRDGNGDQHGWINLKSENGKSLHLTPEGFGVEKVNISTESQGENKAGLISLYGPSSRNIWMGSKTWEDMDLPFFQMLGRNEGENEHSALELSVMDDANESAYIELRSKDSYSSSINSRELYLTNAVGGQSVTLRSDVDENGNDMGTIHVNSPESKTAYLTGQNIALMDNANDYTKLVDINTNNESGNGWAGNLILRGPDSENFRFGSRWENSNLPLMSLIGENYFDAMEFSVISDGNSQFGTIHVNSDENKSLQLNAQNIALRDNENNHKHLVDLDINNNSGNGWAGNISLRGPDSDNVRFGAQWDNSNLPTMFLTGENDFAGMQLSVIADGNGDQHGRFHLNSENGSFFELTPNGFTSEKASLFNADQGFGVSSMLNLFGENTLNVQLGGQDWANGDLGYFSLYSDKVNSNGGHLQVIQIAADSDATNSWGWLTVLHDEDVRISLDGKSGDINISGTLNQSSDRRLKKDIVQLSGALENINRIQGVSYLWKNDETNTNPQIGLIAQEVEKVYPELVVTKKDGYKALNYSQLVAVLVEATKELNAKVEKLETENVQLKAELSATVTSTPEFVQLQNQVQAMARLLQQNEEVAEEQVFSPGLK